MLIDHKVFFKRCYGDMNRIRDLMDVLGLPHLYKVFTKEFIHINNKSQGACTVIYLLLRGCQCGYSTLPYCRAQSVSGVGG